MKRFTERKGDGISYTTGRYKITCYPKNGNLSDVDKMAVRLCELEDKLKNGMLVELSKFSIYQLSVACKGTSSENYFIDEMYPVLVAANSKWELVYKDRLCNSIYARTLIGYFYTKDEAEARMKELQGGRQ